MAPATRADVQPLLEGRGGGFLPHDFYALMEGWERPRSLADLSKAADIAVVLPDRVFLYAGVCPTRRSFFADGKAWTHFHATEARSFHRRKRGFSRGEYDRIVIENPELPLMYFRRPEQPVAADRLVA